MASARTWVVSLAAAGGVAGGGVAGLTPASSPGPAPQPGGQQAAPDLVTLQRQVAALLAEDRALHVALAQARRRLAGQVTSRDALLAQLQRRLAGTQAAVRAARGAAPAAHASTGASGAAGGHDD